MQISQYEKIYSVNYISLIVQNGNLAGVQINGEVILSVYYKALKTRR